MIYYVLSYFYCSAVLLFFLSCFFDVVQPGGPNELRSTGRRIEIIGFKVALFWGSSRGLYGNGAGKVLFCSSPHR